MKKIFNILFVTLLAMNLVACTNSTTSAKSEFTYDEFMDMLEIIPVTTENINDYLEWYEFDWREADDSGNPNPYGYYGTTKALKLKDGYAVSDFNEEDEVVINYIYQITQNKRTISGDDGKLTIHSNLSYEAIDENSGTRACDIWEIDELYALGGAPDPILETELVTFKITNAKGNIYYANIPEDAWAQTTEDYASYTAEELGRHITIVSDGSKSILYENGVIVDTTGNALHLTNPSYVMLLFYSLNQSNQTSE